MDTIFLDDTVMRNLDSQTNNCCILGQQTLVEYTQGVSNETNEDVRMYNEEYLF